MRRRPDHVSGSDFCTLLRIAPNAIFLLAEAIASCISSNMKTLAVRWLMIFVMLAAASIAFAGQFKSKIVTTQVLTITVPDDHFIKITNFSQQGGIDRGVIEVMLQGDTESSGTANVLTATRVDLSTGNNAQNAPEISNRAIIAGPAEIRIQPIAGATLFITYRKESNEGTGGGGGGGSSPTPFPIFISPTPTLTPSPTPFGA